MPVGGVGIAHLNPEGRFLCIFLSLNIWCLRNSAPPPSPSEDGETPSLEPSWIRTYRFHA